MTGDLLKRIIFEIPRFVCSPHLSNMGHLFVWDDWMASGFDTFHSNQATVRFVVLVLSLSLWELVLLLVGR